MNQMGDKTLKPQQMLGQDLDKRGIWSVNPSNLLQV